MYGTKVPPDYRKRWITGKSQNKFVKFSSFLIISALALKVKVLCLHVSELDSTH
jgi:hypothetical protein